jgi:hypothetical protein
MLQWPDLEDVMCFHYKFKTHGNKIKSSKNLPLRDLKNSMAKTIPPAGITLCSPYKRSAASAGSFNLDCQNQTRLVLVAFGYSMKDSRGEREIALSAAAARHGAPAVSDRLEFLKGAWCGTQKFLEVIHQDLAFVESMTE